MPQFRTEFQHTEAPGWRKPQDEINWRHVWHDFAQLTAAKRPSFSRSWARISARAWLRFLTIACGLVARGVVAQPNDPPPIAASAPHDAPLIATDPVLLAQLEARGLSLDRVLGAAGPDTAALHAGSAFRVDGHFPERW